MQPGQNAVFSFFSGAGFLDLGFESVGFDVVFANEVVPAFAEAYAYARMQMGLPLPKYGIDTHSIERWLDVPFSTQLKRMIREARALDSTVGFIGGPPCPDFSVGGKNRGRNGDNGKLTKTYFDLILSQKPDWFLFENVKGLWRTARHRAFYEEMKRAAEAAGYQVSDKLVNAIEYGVPQDRDRIILVGVRQGSHRLRKHRASATDVHTFPWNVGIQHERSVLQHENWPTTNGLGFATEPPRGIPLELTTTHWFEQNQVATHPNAVHGFRPRAGLARFQTVAEGDDSRKSFKRLHRWRYSPTAAYGNNEVHLHPTEPRRITVAEALAIQSLPQGFALPPNMTLSAMFKTVGNGVPYLMARGLATMMKKVLE